MAMTILKQKLSKKIETERPRIRKLVKENCDAGKLAKLKSNGFLLNPGRVL